MAPEPKPAVVVPPPVGWCDHSTLRVVESASSARNVPLLVRMKRTFFVPELVDTLPR